MNPAEDYILKQSEPFRGMLMHLQSVIEHTFSDVELKFKYRVPFYYVNGKPFCYLNAPVKKDYIDLGIWYGAHLTKHKEHLIVENRTVIRSLRYVSLKEIDNTILVEILQEAYTVRNEKFYK